MTSRSFPALVLCLLVPALAMAAEKDAIRLPRFSHPEHLAREGAACSSCHPAAVSSRKESDDNRARLGACASCHGEAERGCPECRGPAQRRVGGAFRDRNLVFSHARHAAENLACDDCHDLEPARPGVPAAAFPPMSDCLNCHRETSCSTCHPDVNRPGFQPDSHDAFWPEQHRRVDTSELVRCSQCHASSWCQDCHQGDIEWRPHDETFRTSHGLVAQLSPAGCQTCHFKNFCANCHGALGGGR